LLKVSFEEEEKKKKIVDLFSSSSLNSLLVLDRIFIIASLTTFRIYARKNDILNIRAAARVYRNKATR